MPCGQAMWAKPSGRAAVGRTAQEQSNERTAGGRFDLILDTCEAGQATAQLTRCRAVFPQLGKWAYLVPLDELCGTLTDPCNRTNPASTPSNNATSQLRLHFGRWNLCDLRLSNILYYYPQPTQDRTVCRISANALCLPGDPSGCLCYLRSLRVLMILAAQRLAHRHSGPIGPIAHGEGLIGGYMRLLSASS